MTRNDRAMLLGCLAVGFLAMISLSAPAKHASEATTIAAFNQSLQLARVHSLTGTSMRAVSVY